MKQDNAQSRLEKSQPLLGSNTTFLDAYPHVEELSLEVRANPMGFGQVQTYRYSLLRPPGQYCPCPNPQCKGGGFNIGSFLYDLISTKRAEGEIGGHCVGREQMNRRDTRSCFYSFQVKASLKYKEK